MVNSYHLVNPHIEGNFKSKVKAMNSNEAANLFYKNLSEHFNNSVPSFHFTIQKGSSGSGKYYHFKVKENRKANQVSFSVKPMEIKGLDMDSFRSKLDNFKTKIAQGGGEKSKSKKQSKDDDDSDWDDSSEEFYSRAKSYVPVTQPIYYWWYDPSLYRLDSIFIPTFYSYITPYIELSLRL